MGSTHRPRGSANNHGLVAAIAGVVLLCGVVSVQNTQASVAFSKEQGMARAAQRPGTDVDTAADATWWSFWRVVHALPHAYDAATAQILGAGDRGHASLDRALAEKKAEIERLRAQTAALKAEQARILAGARARAAAPASVGLPAEELPAAGPPAADPAAAAAEAATQKYEARRAARRVAPRRAAAIEPAGTDRALRGIVKKRHARLRNAAASCTLVVRAQDGNKGDAEGDESTWLRCDAVQTEGVEAVFEVTQGGAPDTLRLKSLANNLYVEMVPPTRRLGWVVRAVVQDPGKRTLPTCDFRQDGKSFKAVAANGAITVIVDGQLRDSNTVRGHGNKPNNAQGGNKNDRYAQFVVQYLNDEDLEKAKTAQIIVEKEQTALLTTPAEVACTTKCVVSYGLYGTDPKYNQGAIRNAELVKTIFPGWTARFYHREDVPVSILNELKELGAELVLMSKGSQTTKGAIAGMFWRFLVADDDTVERFIVRDSDSRLNAREAHAVAEWMRSGEKVHTIRDHPNHDRPLNGGLWGGTKGCIPGGIAEHIRKFANKQGYGGDLQFLNEVVWPRVKHSQLAHDAYTCRKYPNSKPFPTKRPDNYQHVGQVFDSRDRSRARDINGAPRRPGTA